jgi:hypothetical protein
MVAWLLWLVAPHPWVAAAVPTYDQSIASKAHMLPAPIQRKLLVGDASFTAAEQVTMRGIRSMIPFIDDHSVKDRQHHHQQQQQQRRLLPFPVPCDDGDPFHLFEKETMMTPPPIADGATAVGNCGSSRQSDVRQKGTIPKSAGGGRCSRRWKRRRTGHHHQVARRSHLC